MREETRLMASDGGSFAAYLALPARLPAPALVVLPEIFNANPHIRSVADGWAADGFIALAPDVFWRQEAGCYLPYTDEGRTKARALQALLDTEQYARDLADIVAALRARMNGELHVGCSNASGNAARHRSSVDWLGCFFRVKACSPLTCVPSVTRIVINTVSGSGSETDTSNPALGVSGITVPF